MVNKLETMNITLTVGSNNMKTKQHKLTVLHQNICSLRHKVTDLEVLLSTELKDVDVLCLKEHWQNAQTISCTNICNFKPVSAFCRMSTNHGGSGIYVKDGQISGEMSCFTEICEETNFEMPLIELPIYKLIIVCIYRSPDGYLGKFLAKLELVIQKL